MARLNPKLAGALLVVLVVILTTTNEDAVSAFIASSKNRRAPAPALIVVRDPVPSIDWDIFEMEEQEAFDSAVIRRNTEHYYRTNAPFPEDALKTTVHTPIEIPADDPDAWKGSLLMATGLLVAHHDIPAMTLLLSTAAPGEFGTAVRLTSRCVWNAVDVCTVLSTEGFQSISELLKDVGVVPEEETKKGNWMVSWAKKAWKHAVTQEREWADALRQSFVPDDVEEVVSTKQDVPQASSFPIGSTVPISSAASIVEQAKEEPQAFAAVLHREDAVLSLPVKPTDVSGNKQRVRDLMRQQRELQQQGVLESPDEFELSPQVTETIVKAPESTVNSRQRVRDLMRQQRDQQQQSVLDSPEVIESSSQATETIVQAPETPASSRQRVRDLMRQGQHGTTVSQEQVTTPSLFTSQYVTTTAAARSTTKSAADSRQRVRDLMRQRREQDSASETMCAVTAKETPPSLFTMQRTSPSTVQTAKQKAAFSRQRVRDLMRQKQEEEARKAQLASTAELKERISAAQPQEPVASMEESFRKQRALNSSVRNKIRGLVMQKRMMEKGMLEPADKSNTQDDGAEVEQPVTASGWSPLTMTEKKSLQEARATLVARKTMANSSAAAVGPAKRKWRTRIIRLLTRASPQGWVESSVAKQHV